MSDLYLRNLLQICVVQICQTIGYQAIQTAPVELLLDAVHKFLHEFSRDMKRQVEHYNRTEAHLNDVHLSLNNLNINISELLDYINNVEPVSCATEVTRVPARKNSNLNFLKPGSREVLSRPVHIYEHLPPMLPPDSSKALRMNYMECKPSASKSIVISLSLNPALKVRHQVAGSENISTPYNRTKRFFDPNEGVLASEITPICLKPALNLPPMIDDEGRPMREICSVVMTTGGFISPAIEGKIPDSVIPKYFGKLLGLDALLPPTPHSNCLIGSEPITEDKLFSSRLSGKVDFSGTANTSSFQHYVMPANVEDVMNSIKETSIELNVVNLEAAKNPSPIRENAAIGFNLLSKDKKQITYNSQAPSNDKIILQDISTPVNGIFKTGPSDKTQRKNKKILQKLLKTETDSYSLSPDFCNTVFQRLKMEKTHKNQTKSEKKFTKQNRSTMDLKKQDFYANMSNLHEIKLSLTEGIKAEIKNDTPSVEKDGPPCQVIPAIAPIYQPKLDHTEILSSLPHCTLKDNDFSVIEGRQAFENTQIPTKLCVAQNRRAIPEIKLSAELDRNKLNIFKKISKQKQQKPPTTKKSMASTPICRGDTHINLPCGTTINRLVRSGEANLVCTESTKSFCMVSNNSEIGNVIDLEMQRSDGTFLGVPLMCSTTRPLQHEEINKPKKRGRKPGSKNSPREPVELSNDLSEVASLKKTKKLKSFKQTYSLPPAISKNINSIHSESRMSHNGKVVGKKLDIREYVGTTDYLTQIKHNRKEHRKVKAKKPPLTLCVTKQDVSEADVIVPTKEEVNNINEKLMRMDTVLQPLGYLNESKSETDRGPKAVPVDLLPKCKSVSGNVRQASLLQNAPVLLPGFPPNVFMPTAGLGGLPNLLKFCPFPPRPGLIPPTAPNLLFPRLPATFHLPIPNIKQQQHYNAGKAVEQDSSANGTTNDAILQQLRERNYSNVPPLVPESMKLAPFDTNVYVTKQTTSGCLKRKDVAETAPHDLRLNIYETQKEIEIVSVNSPNLNTPNPLVGSTSFQSTSINKITMPIKASSVMNNNDPIELSDESVDYSPIFYNTSSENTLKDLDKVQIVAPVGSFRNKREIVNSIDDLGKADHEFEMSMKDQKKIKKTNKVVKNRKSIFQRQGSGLSQIDFIGTEKIGVSKLAGGADLIPLISTGSAYSSKTIPSTSLTATTAASLASSDNDYPTTSTFINTIMSTNLKNEGNLNIGTATQRKKKEHKKIKKLKDVKTKKKKEKKSKNKEQIDFYKSNKLQMITLKAAMGTDGDQHLKHQDFKKIKRGKKKKCKQLRTQSTLEGDIYAVIDKPGVNSDEKTTTSFVSSNPICIPAMSCISSSTKAYVPKLTLKLGSGKSPLTFDDSIRKHSSTLSAVSKNEPVIKRDPSPELARILPLVTRPLKQKLSIEADSVNSPLSSEKLTPPTHTRNTIENKINASQSNTQGVLSVVPPPSPWSSGGTISASSVLLPQQLLQSNTSQEKLELNSNGIAVAKRSSSSTARQSPIPIISEESRPSSYIDADGNRVWICPACGKVDDGSPMIGCDGCDAWYHWICVGICIAPKDNEDWFCRVCITRKKGINATDKKRRRHKKK